jgi:hypothetical protein
MLKKKGKFDLAGAIMLFPYDIIRNGNADFATSKPLNKYEGMTEQQIMSEETHKADIEYVKKREVMMINIKNNFYNFILIYRHV